MAKINPIRAGKVIKPFDPSGSSPFLQISASNRGISGLAQTVVTTVAELKNDIDQKADEERIYNKWKQWKQLYRAISFARFSFWRKGDHIFTSPTENDYYAYVILVLNLGNGLNEWTPFPSL